MDILIPLNIKVLKDHLQEPTLSSKKDTDKSVKIDHEFYYWNIIVLSQLVGNVEMTEVISKDFAISSQGSLNLH